MLNIRKAVVTGLAVVSFCAVWHAKAIAQENASPGVVTVFSRDKVAASCDQALAKGGSSLLWNHTSSEGTYNVDTHSRESVKSACKPEGCGHKGYVAVVYVVSGSATLVVGGTTKSAAPDKFGGISIQGGESHRIGKGDVFIMPPDTIHWYKDVKKRPLSGSASAITYRVQQAESFGVSCSSGKGRVCWRKSPEELDSQCWRSTWD
jgi:mannose-6-phosphate isomerase-like protein (cupin superfamily)